MFAVKLIQIDDSVGFILPTELLSLLKVGESNMVSLTETANGFTLTSYEADFDEQLKLGRELAQGNCEKLHQLAK